ncbi:MAG TPA: nuclear transport factor 2 family protein [Caulobacteraceae bacterium]|nr:nuclear transport factor 2 family protein [Caulobacteraceae bacterium]
MKTDRSSLTAIAGAVIAMILAASVYAQPGSDDRSQVVAVVQRFFDAFNRGDTVALKSVFENDVSLIDDMPPFAWRGQGALDAWLADADKDGQLNKDTDAVSVIGAPRFVRIVGDRAYAVFPDQFSYKRNGRQIREDATATFVLRRTDVGWRVISAAYAAAEH